MSTRFLIIGLPRSGTTYMATLLDSHPEIHCAGELFNPFAIIGLGWKDADAKKLLARDAAPADFLKRFFSKPARGAGAIGAKFMIGHHPEIMTMIEEDPGIRIVYVHRYNKLAQSASWFKALRSRQWAMEDAQAVDRSLLPAWPRDVARQVREMETSDRLVGGWLRSLRNPVCDVEYRSLFTEDFRQRICAFLDVSTTVDLVSGLIKQGEDNILDRFEHREQIEKYFREIGRSDWLLPEIASV